MPSFLIVGAPKSGTSSLYAYLKQHPDIFMAPIKEPNFFMLDNKPVEFQGPGDRERLIESVHQLEAYQALFEGATERAIGEASAGYLGSELAPARIKQLIPEVKLVVVLRNPIEAAYSSYLHLMRDGDETIKDFSMALQAEAERTQNNWGLLWRYQQRAMYYEQVHRYLSTFNKSQIRIYLFEEFKQDTDGLLRDIFEFVDVDPDFKPHTGSRRNVSAKPKSVTLNQFIAKPNVVKDTIKRFLPLKMRQRLYHQVRSWNLNNFKKPEMPTEARERLRTAFRADILRLEDLIERDLSGWLK